MTPAATRTLGRLAQQLGHLPHDHRSHGGFSLHGRHTGTIFPCGTADLTDTKTGIRSVYLPDGSPADPDVLRELTTLPE